MFTLVIYFHVFQSRKFIHCVQKLSFESPDNIFGRLVRLFIIRDFMPPSLFISDHEQITCRLLSLGHLNILSFLLLSHPFSSQLRHFLAELKSFDGRFLILQTFSINHVFLLCVRSHFCLILIILRPLFLRPRAFIHCFFFNFSIF